MHDSTNSAFFARFALGSVGAVLGAAIGSALFVWALNQGFYMIAFPGAATGIGCSMLSRTRSVSLGILCGLIAAAVSLWLEWYKMPMIADDSFPYFLTHLHQLPPMKQLLWLLGIVFAVWFGTGRGTSR